MTTLLNEIKKLGYKPITKKIEINWDELTEFIREINKFEEESSKVDFIVKDIV